ncbi:hypothetical protein SDJN03_07568, partial [Cucurbita argyrosperma subsp. sororia]
MKNEKLESVVMSSEHRFQESQLSDAASKHLVLLPCTFLLCAIAAALSFLMSGRVLNPFELAVDDEVWSMEVQ